MSSCREQSGSGGIGGGGSYEPLGTHENFFSDTDKSNRDVTQDFKPWNMMEYIDTNENVDQRINRAALTPIKYRFKLASQYPLKRTAGSSTKRITKKRRASGMGLGVFRHRFSSPHKKFLYSSPSKLSPSKRQWLDKKTPNRHAFHKRGLRIEAATPRLVHDQRPFQGTNPSTTALDTRGIRIEAAESHLVDENRPLMRSNTSTPAFDNRGHRIKAAEPPFALNQRPLMGSDPSSDYNVDNSNIAHDQNNKISKLEDQVTSMEKETGHWRCLYISEQNHCHTLMDEVQQKDKEIQRLNEEAQKNKERVDKIIHGLNISEVISDSPASNPSVIDQHQISPGTSNLGSSKIHQNGTFMSDDALKSFSNMVASSVVKEATKALNERQTDFAYGIGLSGNQVDLVSRVLTNETTDQRNKRRNKDNITGQNKRRKVSTSVSKEAESNDIVQCVTNICNRMGIERPLTKEAIEKCEALGKSKKYTGFWRSVAHEWNGGDMAETPKRCHLQTDLKTLYAQKMNIELGNPEGRVKPRDLHAEVDLPSGEKYTINFPAPIVPRSEKCRQKRNQQRRGNANPASGPGFTKLDLQKLQKIPKELEDDRDNMIRAMQVAGMHGKKASEVNWEHLIQVPFTAQDGQQSTLQERHRGWENTALLAFMFQRLYENRLESEAHKAFGAVPSDDDVRQWAFNEDCYIGQEVRFRHDDGTTVDMRVLHIRAVVLLFLQQCHIDGVLKKPDNPLEPREFKDVCNWKDATNAAKKSVCCCCYKLANDHLNFELAKALFGTVPMMWAVSQNMSETKLNYDLMNTTDSLLHDYLKEPIEIYDKNGEVFATYDVSKWKSVIGDAHYNEVRVLIVSSDMNAIVPLRSTSVTPLGHYNSKLLRFS